MFTVGQEVWCLIYGQGVVTDVDSKRTEETYPVFVKFQNYDELHISYTMEGKFHNQGNITLFPYPVEVVKASIKPSIDWSQIKDEYKWLAVDVNGCAYVYENEPTSDNSAYWSSGNATYFHVNGLVSYSRGTCDWEHSLVKRPETDSKGET